MIVVGLKGGLGNQMFQYAAGRALAMRYNAELVLDLSFFNGEQNGCTPRHFMLDVFKVAARYETFGNAVAFDIPMNFLGRVRFLARSATGFRTGTMFRFIERSCEFDRFFRWLPDNIYLDGYWQSEQYFDSVFDTIQADFKPLHVFTAKTSAIASEIQSVNSISIHVRRGDYVNNPDVAKVHGACDVGYYRTCVAEMACRVSDPVFYVFTDDKDWVNEHFDLPVPFTVVSRDGGLPHEDMLLMSLCRHNIIANSSFSWWGAWLNANSEKIIMAPRRWFSAAAVRTDIIPNSWITI